MDSTQSNPRLAFRMKPELKQRIETAAQVLGLSLTDFVLSTLSDRAAQVLEREESLTLTHRDRDLFLAELNRPGRPIPALARAIQKDRQRRRA